MDSSLVAAVTPRALGPRALAVTAISPALAADKARVELGADDLARAAFDAIAESVRDAGYVEVDIA